MDIEEAFSFKTEIITAIYTGDVDKPNKTEEAFRLIYEFAEAYKDYLTDAAND